MSKNIHDLSDEELDDLFRQSAEKTNIGFDPDAWNKMNQKLDAATKPQSGSVTGGNLLKRRGLALLIVLLFTISGIYLLIKKPAGVLNETKTTGTNTKNADLKRTETKKTAIVNNTQSADNPKGDTGLLKNKVENEVKESENASKKIADKQRSIKLFKTQTPAPAGNTERDIATAGTEKRKRQKLTVELDKNSVSITIKAKSGNSEPVENSTNNQVIKSDNQFNVPAVVATSTRVQLTPVHLLSIHQRLPEINLHLPEIAYKTVSQVRVQQIPENTVFRKGLNVRLALSPDLSFIPSNRIGKIGSNWAAMLEYRFNNRLSVQTGVIRSTKLYDALPEQYEWADYLSLQSLLKDINATCKMLDIPINLRYDLSTKPNSRWFVSGGFTSYIMLKETYRYNYENPSDPYIKYEGWEGETGSYPFSVFNLSAGYERQIFRRLTFQVEPVFKTPLGKVGYGKVKLATAGVFFSVKYPF